MNKFKIGDRVKLISDYGQPTNKTGDIGVITEDDGSGVPYRVTVDGRKNCGNWVSGDQLELVQPEPTFKQGDKVRIVKRDSGNASGSVNWSTTGDIGTVGYISTIRHSEMYGAVRPYQVLLDLNAGIYGSGNYLGWFTSEELELVVDNVVNQQVMTKTFKNKIAVTGDKVLLEAFSKKLDEVGYNKTRDNDLHCTHIIAYEDGNYGFHTHSGHNTNIILTVPLQWDEALKLASEVDTALKFVVGKWYKYTDSKFMFKYTGGSIESGCITKSAGCTTDGVWSVVDNFQPSRNDARLIREATDDEVKAMLIKQIDAELKSY